MLTAERYGWLLVAAGLAILAGLELPLWPALIALIVVWLYRRFSAPLVLRLLGAVPAGVSSHEVLYRRIDALSECAGLKPPRLYIVDSKVPNAFVLGRDGRDSALGVTSGLLAMLDEQEMAGVMAHELAHLVQRREAGFGGAFAFNGGIPLLVGIGRSAMVFMAGRGGVVSRAAMPTLSAGVNFLGGRSVPHSLEFAADAKGAALCGDPLWLARALRKLDDARPASESPRFLSTHPAVAERIRRLEAQACGAYIH